MTRHRRLVFLVVLVVGGCGVNAQETVLPPPSHAALVRKLESLIAHEINDKKLPALSIALVDNQKVIWARGFGLADPREKKPATARTVYRVGSVSKLFTDLAVMQQVEKGQLDLDAPVSRYLPDFKPSNPFDRPITLRQLMAHRSGLVRESPVGSYFDAAEPSLAKTVASLNATALVYPPQEKTKYSNAGLAVVGRVLEVTQKTPFDDLMRQSLFAPLGLKQSSFRAAHAVKAELAQATMWTYHGREFPAPTWELAMPPAGNLYTSVLDLAQLLRCLFDDGAPLLKKQTLESMYQLQFAQKDDKAGFGLGFQISEFQGRRRIGHGGAVYGFSTDFSALPDEKLGVVVVASRDVVNAVTTRIASAALELLLAVKQGKPLPSLTVPEPLDAETARRAAGRYESGTKTLELEEWHGPLYAWVTPPGLRIELRQEGDAFVYDDRLGQTTRLHSEGDKLLLGKDVYRRVERKKPAPLPEPWRGLIGEYGWDHNVLYILEKDGKLHCLIEWVFLYPLEQESENVFRFPSDYGLYHGEKLKFTRDRAGKAVKVEAAEVVFPRRRLDGEDGRTFRIEPRRAIADIRKEALAAKSPAFKGEFNRPDLVELTALDAGIKLDIRYASTNNFLGVPFYQKALAFLQRPAAEAVVRVHRRLAQDGFGLLIHDGYRPWHVTKMFRDATPERFHHFVADPLQGSRHNRGCAVDLTLYDLKTGKAVEMPGGYDEFSDRSYPDYPGGTSAQRGRRDLLRRTMEAEGFTVYEAEWWHFDHRDWRKYPVLNLTFEELVPAK